MIRLMIFLVVTAALAFLAAWLADNPGQVTVEVAGYVVQTRLGVMLGLVAALGFVLALLLELLGWLRRTPRRLRVRRERLRERKGYQELSMGLIAAAAGDLTGARVHSQRAQRLLGSDPAAMLLSAQAAQLDGREDVARERFEAMLGNRETELLALRGLLAQALRAGDREEALRLARRAQARSPNTPWVVTTLLDLQTRSGLWHEALRSVDDLQRLRQIEPATAARRRAVLHHMLALAHRDRGQTREALKHARRTLEFAPGFAPGAVLFAECARQAGRSAEARKGLERAWGTQPHPMIAKAYAELVQNETALERLKRCQRLAELQPNRFETHIALGELALAAGDHDKARSHVERALALSPTAGAYRLMAEIARRSGAPAEQIQAWLEKAVDAPPDHAWVCEQTGWIAAEWSPFGPGGLFDSLRWTTPPKVQALRGDEGPAMVITQDYPPAPPAQAASGSTDLAILPELTPARA